MHFKYLTILILFGVVGCTETPVAEIVERQVPVDNSTDREWREGWLRVPENRSAAESNFIELPFILSKADSSTKEGTPPILIMSGGPGNSSLHMANGVVNTPWGKNRDILILEQRGTRHALPCLSCPEVDSLRIQGIERGTVGIELEHLKLLGASHCYERLLAEHIDLASYNTLESVADIEALRVSLNIEKLILYGMSYSCNLMTAYAQTYPAHTQAIILDSPLPHHINYDEEAKTNVDSILLQIVEHYTGSHELYYNWLTYVSEIQDSVFQVEIGASSYNYTSNELIDLVLFGLSSHGSIPDTPNSLRKIMAGDHDDVRQVVNYYLEASGQALGMRYSLWVTEELSEEQESAVDAQNSKHPWLADYPVNDVSFDLEKVWMVNSMYDTQLWPSTIYDGPVLILSGQFDPWTPPWYGKSLINPLPQCRHLIYPEHTHLPGFTQKGFEDILNFIIETEGGNN